jgi:hypothetical protein
VGFLVKLKGQAETVYREFKEIVPRLKQFNNQRVFISGTYQERYLTTLVATPSGRMTLERAQFVQRQRAMKACCWTCDACVVNEWHNNSIIYLSLFDSHPFLFLERGGNG